jgi:hypothetical protein
MKEKLKVGDEVRVDSNYKVAIEVLARPHSDEYYLDSVPELPWAKVGGQEEALHAIRDAIELPLLHPDLFRRFNIRHRKDFSFTGRPVRQDADRQATAFNLTQQLKEQSGEEMREYFMHIKGPEILNMWVGESERMVREIFSTAREKRREGYLPFLSSMKRRAFSARGAPRVIPTSSRRSYRCFARKWTASSRCTKWSSSSRPIVPISSTRRHSPTGPDRSQNQGGPSDARRCARDFQDLPRTGSSLRPALVKEAGDRGERRHSLVDTMIE